MAAVQPVDSNQDDALCATCKASVHANALGVDIGTTTTLVAEWDVTRSEPVLAYNSRGRPWCLSVPVYNADTGECLGLEHLHAHDAQACVHLRGIKRLVGVQFSDPRTQRDIATCGCIAAHGGAGAVPIEGDSDVVRVQVAPGVTYTPMQVTQDIVRAALDNVVGACTCGARLPREAVVTVPADFTPLQRSVTLHAAQRAGLRVLQLVNEPTAALLHAAAAGRIPPPSSDHTAVVFDWGGGTFDATVLTPDIDGAAYDVLASAGDAHLGGADVDAALAAARGISVQDAAIAKEGVAIQNTYFVGNVAVTRQHVADAAALSVRRAVHLTVQAVSRSGCAASSVTHVVLVGGSTGLPGVYEALQAAFPLATIVQWHGAETRTSVACGAAWLAHQLQTARATREQRGADASTAALANAPPCVHDALTHSVGVRVAQQYLHKVLHRDAPLPASGAATFTTQHDGQVVFDVDVFAGESTLTSQCTPLGSFRIHGVPPAPAGAQRVRIALQADESGTVRVSATHSGNTVDKTMHLVSTHADKEGQDASDEAAGGEQTAQDLAAQEHMRLWQKLWNTTVRAKRAARSIEGTPFAAEQCVVDTLHRVKTVCDVQHEWMRAVSARQADANYAVSVRVQDLDDMRRRTRDVMEAMDAHKAAVHTASLKHDVFLAASGENLADAEEGARWLKEHQHACNAGAAQK